MKALSIRQPWAWLIVRPDVADQATRAQLRTWRCIKDVENRTWSTGFRGRFLVHAGKTYTQGRARDPQSAGAGQGVMDEKMLRELDAAQEKATEALKRYKFLMFGYWAAWWVKLNRLAGAKRPNPFKPIVLLARQR